MQITALAGTSGSGKSTVALMLADILTAQGETVILDTIIQPLRAHMHVHHPDADEAERRRLMQEMGAAARRADPDCYIKALALRNSLPNSRPGFLIISDLRLCYQNEVEYCASRGVVWRVMNPNHHPLFGEAAAHESEQEPLLWSTPVACGINNCGNLDDLRAHVRYLVREGWHLRGGI